MASQFGINTVTSVNAARPLRVQSSTPIGLVGTAVLPANDSGFTDAESKTNYAKLKAGENVLFGSSSKAKAFFEGMGGTIYEAVDGIDDQNVEGPLIISAITITAAERAVSGETFHGNAAIKSKVIQALDKLRMAAAQVGYKPNLIIAPRFSHDLDVATQITATAERLLAFGVVDLNVATEAAAILSAKNFGTKRLLLRDPYIKVWDTQTNTEALQPQSARIAGMIAATDAAWEYGFADSHSNRVMNGISGTARPIEFAAGQDCEADRLRVAGVGTVIRYDGFRTWGGETTDIDPIWQDHTRVRVFDRLCEAALTGLFWAIDRRADQLKSVKDSVEQMLLALRGASVLLGYSVYWDPDKNTRATITAGKFYLTVETQNVPIVKRLEINFSYVDRYGDVLIKAIS